MLIINTCNNKLAAMRVDFASRGMLSGMCLGKAIRLFAGDPSGNKDEPSSQDGIREVGRNLDLDTTTVATTMAVTTMTVAVATTMTSPLVQWTGL